MPHVTICGIDAEPYLEAECMQAGITRIDYHCEGCGRVFRLISIGRPLTIKAIHDQEFCGCGSVYVVVDAIFVGNAEIPRRPTAAERYLARPLEAA